MGVNIKVTSGGEQPTTGLLSVTIKSLGADLQFGHDAHSGGGGHGSCIGSVSRHIPRVQLHDGWGGWG